LQQRFQLVHSNVTEKSPIAILVNLHGTVSCSSLIGC